VNATATRSSISLCKIFGNKASVNQDGVPWTNHLVATPNTANNLLFTSQPAPGKTSHYKEHVYEAHKIYKFRQS